LMEVGARGNISVTANIAPKPMAAICRAALQGNFALARELNAPLAGLHKHLFCEANPIPVKWAMWKMGLMEDGIRLPLTVLSERCQPVVVEALQTAGLING
jgi:4-hydroxy-tetrahydrodipicolinate synthase